MRLTLRLFGSTMLLIYIFSSSIQGQTVEILTSKLSDAEVEKWRQDLRYLAVEMPKYHKNLFHTLSREQFYEAVKKLDDRIPHLARHQIIVEMASIVAMVGDGHTNISPTRDPKIGFHTYPIKLYFFKDGLYIRAANREHNDIIGGRLLKIGKSSVEQAYTAVAKIVSHDNEMGIKFLAPFLLVMPEVLHTLGIIDNMENAQFLIEKQGRQLVITLQPAGPTEMLPADTDLSWLNKENWSDARDNATNRLPLWLKDPRNKFWFEYLADSKTIFVQINQVGNKENETLAEFCERVFKFVETNSVERFILDLRLNRGGDGTLILPLIVGLIKANKIDQPGRFFTIIGRSTWSAAQFILNELEKYTKVIFVGEPSGSRGNHFGDSRKIILPNSGLTVRVSIYYWQGWHPLDTRPWTAPQLAAEMTSEDYRSNNDPAMRLILAHKYQKPIAERIAEALAKNDPMLAVKIFKEFQDDPVNVYANVENELLILGYQQLKANQTDMAILILKLNAEAYPQSANAFAALGDAYLKNGNRELAITNYEKSLALNPQNLTLQERIKELKR
ncbi:MAG: tetratricopeptide repeat protein [Acidobacteriota bacterium]